MVKTKTVFKKQGKNKVTFNVDDNVLVLKKEKCSRTKNGEVVNLYQERVDGTEIFVRLIGWTVYDGMGSCMNSKAIIRGLTTFEDCQPKALQYVKDLINRN